MLGMTRRPWGRASIRASTIGRGLYLLLKKFLESGEWCRLTLVSPTSFLQSAAKGMESGQAEVFNPEKHKAFLSSAPPSWTHVHANIAWLKEVYGSGISDGSSTTHPAFQRNARSPSTAVLPAGTSRMAMPETDAGRDSRADRRGRQMRADTAASTGAAQTIRLR